MKDIRNLVLFALLVFLAACAGNTDKAESTPAADPAATTPPPATPVPEPPPAEPVAAAPTEAPKADSTPELKAAPKAAPKAAEAKPAAADKAPAATSNRKPGLYAHFQTNQGNFTAELNEKEAPGTVRNFAGLADGSIEWTDPKTGTKQKKPYYDGLTFHRIIDNFMIQGGDPLGTGTGGPGFTIKDENNNLKHDKAGVLAMARTPLPDSAGSQFYITVVATPFLDGQRPPYVVFGQVTEGVDIVQKIGKTPTAPGDRPLSPVVINKITIERVK
jgi:peptidyl-prolyl cis-trans isomerase A (cyclophilin A)